MPGISIIYKKDLEQSLITESLDDLKHEQKYRVQQLFQNNNFMLAFSGYEGYPKQYFENDDTALLLEGLIYNKTDSQIESLLQAISKSYVENNDYKILIRDFVDDSDGDFIVFIYFKQLGEFIIFNDRWGRLPSYYYRDDDMFIFSRELKFILKFIPYIEFDRVSMVEFLVFGYTLGDRTLIKNIYKVSPSCMFSLKLSHGVLEINVEKVFDVNFEESPRTLSRNECVGRCKDLFLQSLDYRINKIREKEYNITADLSGGYDTRAILGGLCRLNAKADYIAISLITGDESEWAEKVAALYDKKPIRCVPAYGLNDSDMSKIIYISDCTVNGWTALSNYQALLERIKHVKGISVRFSGLGGEFIRHPYKGKKYYKTLTDMLKNGYFVGGIKIKHACSIMNLDEETFYNHLMVYFDEYPEPTLRDKVKHLYFEYYHGLVNAGEDMGRLHFWTVSPLWAKDLLSFEMKCIPPKYIGYDFFIEFMRAIDPKLLNAPIYGSSIRLNSKTSIYKADLINLITELIHILISNERLYRFIPKIVKRKSKFKYSDICESIKRDLLENYTGLNILSSCLDEKSVYKYVENEYDHTALYMLLTLILYFREIENKYGDKIVPCKSL